MRKMLPDMGRWVVRVGVKGAGVGAVKNAYELFKFQIYIVLHKISYTYIERCGLRVKFYELLDLRPHKRP